MGYDEVFEFDPSEGGGRPISAAGRGVPGVRYGEKAKEDEVVFASWDELRGNDGRVRYV
jgi:hypothetical protein